MVKFQWNSGEILEKRVNTNRKPTKAITQPAHREDARQPCNMLRAISGIKSGDRIRRVAQPRAPAWGDERCSRKYRTGAPQLDARPHPQQSYVFNWNWID